MNYQQWMQGRELTPLHDEIIAKLNKIFIFKLKRELGDQVCDSIIS